MGQSERRERFSTSGGPWRALSWSQLSRDVSLESHETQCILLKQGFGVAVMVPKLNCVVRGLLLDMLLDKVRPRTFAGHGRVRILEREDDISFFVRHNRRTACCRETAPRTRLVLPRAIPGSSFQLGFPTLRQFHFREQNLSRRFYGYGAVRELMFKS